jgi:ribonuclease HII
MKKIEENINWLKYENEAIQNGYEIVCGVDEAGRGPLAGPVCAAVVILPKGHIVEGVNDSKKLSEKKREVLFDKIIEEALDYSIATASAQEIDEINILQATFLAMKRAVDGLKIKPDLAMIDGNREPCLDIPMQTIIKGDGKSASIACASILAKVTRDRYMLEIAKQYPQYQFEKHKGYGTKLHYEMLDTYGPCEIHRQSFLKSWYAKQ